MQSNERGQLQAENDLPKGEDTDSLPFTDPFLSAMRLSSLSSGELIELLPPLGIVAPLLPTGVPGEAVAGSVEAVPAELMNRQKQDIT